MGLSSSQFPDFVGQFPLNIEPSNDVNLHDLGDLMGSQAGEYLNSSLHEQLDELGHSSHEAGTSLQDPNTNIEEQLGSAADQINDKSGSMFRASSLLEGSAWQPQLIQSLQLNSFENDQVNSLSLEEAPPQTLIQLGNLPQQKTLPLQISIASNPVQNPPSNSGDKWICNHFGCSNTETFKRKCDWQ